MYTKDSSWKRDNSRATGGTNGERETKRRIGQAGTDRKSERERRERDTRLRFGLDATPFQSYMKRLSISNFLAMKFTA